MPCLPCDDRQALYADVPRADTRCSVLLLRCSAWQPCWVYCLAIRCRVLTSAAALAKTAMCFALLYAVLSACAAVPDSIVRCIALIYAAACAAALKGIAVCLACYALLCPVPALMRPASWPQ